MNRYRPARHVGVIERDDTVFLARLPHGPVIRLDGAAAVIWAAACSTEGAAGSTVAERVEPYVDRPLAEIADEVASFIESLIAQQLLEPVPDADQSS